MKKQESKRDFCTCVEPKPRNSAAIPGVIVCDNCMEVISYEGQKKEKSSAPKKEKKAEVSQEKTKRIDFTGVGVEINKIYNEDCEKTIANIKDKQLDYVFTSPPYNVGKGAFAKYEEGKQNSDDRSQQDYLDWTIRIVDGLLRATKNHIFWNVQALTNNKVSLLSFQEHYKYQIKEIFIWKKSSVAPASTKGVTNSAFEYIFCFSNQQPELRNFKDGNFHGNFSNVIEVFREKNVHAEIHKATFPIDLPRTFIKNFGGIGDLWYDPFTGTGTTQKACILERRNFLGSEMSKKYFDLATKEIINFHKDNSLQLEFEQPKKGKAVEQIKMEL